MRRRVATTHTRMKRRDSTTGRMICKVLLFVIPVAMVVCGGGVVIVKVVAAVIIELGEQELLS